MINRFFIEIMFMRVFGEVNNSRGFIGSFEYFGFCELQESTGVLFRSIVYWF
jgi:hypothetical protein